MNYCSVGNHEVFGKVEKKKSFQTEYTECKQCKARRKDNARRKRQHKLKDDDKYNNLFFNFKGL